MPAWALLGGAAGIVIMLALLVAFFRGGAPSNPNTGSAGGSTATGGPPDGTTPAGGHGLIPPPGENETPRGRGTAENRFTPGTPIVPGPVTPSPVRGQARVYQAGEAQRSSDLVYLIIAQTPELKIAERNANKLAESGVDVSIEHMRGGLYGLVSVQGFRTSAEGEALRKKVIEVGRQFPGKGWGDAYFTRVSKPAAAG
jgi:hypothetical protein